MVVSTTGGSLVFLVELDYWIFFGWNEVVKTARRFQNSTK